MNDEVLKAADDLVSAFSDGRLDDYFDAFTPDATFVFYTAHRRIESVAEYRLAWSEWVAQDGFQVLHCVSSDRIVQTFGHTAVFTHNVETLVQTYAGTETLYERETIVFFRNEHGRWLAAHEHLSPSAASAPVKNDSQAVAKG